MAQADALAGADGVLDPGRAPCERRRCGRSARQPFGLEQRQLRAAMRPLAAGEDHMAAG